MKLKDYAGAVVFAVLAVAALFVGIAADKREVFTAVYSLIIMCMAAYIIAYVKFIEREIKHLKELISNKL